MPLRALHTSLHLLTLRTRMPFRYGIATLTDCPHLILKLTAVIDGREQVGYAADNLPPKWFTKDPAQPYEDEQRDMLAVIRNACAIATSAGESATVFASWQHLYQSQKEWAAGTRFPPLLWSFGVSLVERALIDAWCRASGTPFHIALRSGALGLTNTSQFPETPAYPIADLLPDPPLDRLTLRHTVGLTDPLTEAEIPDGERLNDGLPQSLAASIAAYGLTHFKIKLAGDPDPDRDRARLARLANLLSELCPNGYAYTLDGNENYHALPPFRTLWESLAADASLSEFLSHLLFVEQPLHRDVALSPDVARDLHAWTSRPPIIVDESDSLLGAVRTALQSGYVGTSHKNCKGVFKSLANLATLKAVPDRTILSAEDLTNLPPVALMQDLHVAATLGIPHLERNAQHYFAGLSPFPEAVRDAVQSVHPDLYPTSTLRISRGQLRINSILKSPFGTAIDPPLDAFKAIH